MAVALVTGASSGIGREVVKQLVHLNYDVVIVARRESELLQLKQELSTVSSQKVIVKVADLNKIESVAEIFDGLNHLDVLVNCAGMAHFGAVERNTFADDQRTLNVNCLSLVESCRQSLKFMKSGGVIINVSSLASEIPLPHMAVYSASKAFVTNFSLAFAEEVREKGIKVVSVNPGGVNTPFITTAGMDSSVNEKSSAMLVSPAYVAQAIIRSIKKSSSIVVPARTGLLIPFLLWLLPRPIKARLAGAQYKNFYKR